VGKNKAKMLGYVKKTRYFNDLMKKRLEEKKE
jgi:hypothetical protein